MRWQDIASGRSTVERIGEIYGASAMINAWAALHGATQGQLAERIGVSQQHLNRQIRRGRIARQARIRLHRLTGVWLGQPIEEEST